MNYIAPRAEPLIREIPLSRLALAPENVRKTPPDPRADPELKASIAAAPSDCWKTSSSVTTVRMKLTPNAMPPSPAGAASMPCRHWWGTTHRPHRRCDASGLRPELALPIPSAWSGSGHPNTDRHDNPSRSRSMNRARTPQASSSRFYGWPTPGRPVADSRPTAPSDSSVEPGPVGVSEER